MHQVPGTEYWQATSVQAMVESCDTGVRVSCSVSEALGWWKSYCQVACPVFSILEITCPAEQEHGRRNAGRTGTTTLVCL